MKALISVLVLSSVMTLPAAAQDSTTARLVLEELDPRTELLLDSEPLDVSTPDTFRVSPGLHTVEQVLGSRFRWTAVPLIDTVDIAPGEIKTLKGFSEGMHLITSVPEGARVHRNGMLLGTTPYVLHRSETEHRSIDVSREGFETQTIIPSRTLEHVFLLEASKKPQVAGVLRSMGPSLKHETLTIASAVLMVGSSIAAAYLKEKANTSLDEYRRTGSRAALDDVRRFDNYSAAAAATMVISFTGFAYLIELE